MDISELEDATISYSKKVVTLSKDVENSHEILFASIKELKVLCTKGPTFQNLIANTNGVISSLKSILETSTDEDLKLTSFQLIANICVQNKKVQAKVRDELGSFIMIQLNSENAKFVNIASMIAHNMLLNDSSQDIQRAFTTCLRQSHRFDPLPDFLNILLDHFICSHKDIAGEYKSLDEESKKNLLIYVNEHLVNESAE